MVIASAWRIGILIIEGFSCYLHVGGVSYHAYDHDGANERIGEDTAFKSWSLLAVYKGIVCFRVFIPAVFLRARPISAVMTGAE